MPETVELTARDGHSFAAYTATPEHTPHAGLVIVQEIFGVNEHIRTVADRFAAAGYLAVAPALFDRFERHVELAYEGPDRDKAMTFAPRLNMEWHMLDTLAAAEYARSRVAEHVHDAAGGAPVGVVGFCLGGTVAWLASAQLPVQAAVGYYGGGITKAIDYSPKAPLMLHFGADDTHIPLANVQSIHERYPQVPIYTYEGAGHGFANDARNTYNQAAAALAGERTLGFLAEHLRIG